MRRLFALLSCITLSLITQPASADVQPQMQEILNDFQRNYQMTCAHPNIKLYLQISVYPAQYERTFRLAQANQGVEHGWQEESKAQRCDEGDTLYKGLCFRTRCESEQQPMLAW